MPLRLIMLSSIGKLAMRAVDTRVQALSPARKIPSKGHSPATPMHFIINALDQTERPEDISFSDGNPAGSKPKELTKILVSELQRPQRTQARKPQ